MTLPNVKDLVAGFAERNRKEQRVGEGDRHGSVRGGVADLNLRQPPKRRPLSRW